MGHLGMLRNAATATRSRLARMLSIPGASAVACSQCTAIPAGVVNRREATARCARQALPLRGEAAVAVQERYRHIVSWAERAEPPPGPKTGRGRAKIAPGRNLLRQMREHEEAVLAFALVEGVPFTNNQDPQLQDLPRFARAMRLPMIEYIATNDRDSSDAQKVYADALPFLQRYASQSGLAIDDHHPMRALASQIRLDRWPPEGRDAEVVDVLDKVYQALMDNVMTRVTAMLSRHQVSVAHTLARELLRSVQGMDRSAYQAVVQVVDGFLVGKDKDIERDPELKHLQRFARAMRLPMIEYIATNDRDSSDAQKVYADALPFLQRYASQSGLAIDDHHPMRALASQIRLDRWPPEGRDAEVVDVLDKVYQALMDNVMTRTTTGVSAQGSLRRGR